MKEENGILLSMLLRQHFMSSMTLGRWKNWGEAMGQHWGGVHKRLQRGGSIHTLADMQLLSPLSGSDGIARSEKEHVPGLVGKCLRQETFRPETYPTPFLFTHEQDFATSETPLPPHERPVVPATPRLIKSTTGKQEEIELSDSEGEPNHVAVPAVAVEPSQSERELMVARKALRKWYRLAGLNEGKGHEMSFEKGEELGVAWTRGICPRVEGRIQIVGMGDGYA